MSARCSVLLACNGAALPKGAGLRSRKPIRLDYRPSPGGEATRVKLLLPRFVRQVFHLPERVLDLLEIAAYVFAADRFVSRGPKDAVEYHAWPRSLHFAIKVRDHKFWRRRAVQERLNAALCFMSGDREYKFTFTGGHKTRPAGLFDKQQFVTEPEDGADVVLFSGGLDSLTGVVDHLTKPGRKVCLVSHRSGQPGTQRTQDRLFEALDRLYPHRLLHYKFHCGLTGVRPPEETQRTRAFLYASTAFAVASALGLKAFYVYENGMTAFNLIRRQDLMNARASRTTHPRTLGLLTAFFSELAEDEVRIETPFVWKTKTEVMRLLAERGRQDVLTSAVSCSKTFQSLGAATHCGGCSQCIDRRFAAYASRLSDVDVGIYATNFIEETVTEHDVRTTLVDYVRQAVQFATWNSDHFQQQTLLELADLIGHVPAANDEEGFENVWGLCHRHGEQVLAALKKMREVHDDPRQPLPTGCLLQIIGSREYLKEPVKRLIEAICERLTKAIPLTFHSNLPKDERDFKDKVSGILAAEKEQLDREHPSVLFALGHAVPDHSSQSYDLFIEYKYVRGDTTPGKASEGIGVDLIKYPSDQHVLAVVYDPYRRINDDEVYKRDIEKKRHACTVFVLR